MIKNPRRAVIAKRLRRARQFMGFKLDPCDTVSGGLHITHRGPQG